MHGLESTTTLFEILKLLTLNRLPSASKRQQSLSYPAKELRPGKVEKSPGASVQKQDAGERRNGVGDAQAGYERVVFFSG